MGGLASEIRRVHGYCLESSDSLTRWLAANPTVSKLEARSMASMSHGVPFPSIRGLVEGPFPVYKDRPYFDARFHEGEESSPSLPRRM
jgi:hypothetical protein